MSGAGKKKGKKKGVTLNLSDFLANSPGVTAAPGSSFVVSKKSSSWADDVGDDVDAGTSYIDTDSRVLLPTAPRSAQAIALDVSQLPDSPPYTVYLGNIPFDCSEEDIKTFLTKCDVSNVRFPKDIDGRFKGFCYAEIDDLESLKTALSLNDEPLRTRRIKVDLATQDNRGGDRGGESGGYDRTQDDWRRDDDDNQGGRGGGGNNDNQEWGRGRERNDEVRPGDKDEGVDDWRSMGINNFDDVKKGGGYQDRRGGGGYEDRSGSNDDWRGGSDNNDRRSGYDDRSGGYNDRRGGGYDDRRGGGYDDRRGGYDDRRSGYGDRRGGGYDDRRGGGYDDRRGGGYDRRGGYDDRRGGGYDDKRGGGYNDRQGGGGFDDKRGGGYEERRGGGSDDQRASGEERAGYRKVQHDDGNVNDSPPSDQPRREGNDDGFKGRKKLVLTKRTQPVEPKQEGGSGSSIFGGAKPVDTSAREKEIEERLQRRRDADVLERKRIEGEKDVNRRERPERTRTESETSSGGHEGRTRHSSSGSGRSGPKPVMIRRESERSNDEDTVFHKDDPTSPVAVAASPTEPTSPKSPKSFKDEPPKVVIPAPPPKENAWARRNDSIVSPRSNPSSRTSSSSESAKDPTSPKNSTTGGTHDDKEKRKSPGDPRGGQPNVRRPSDKKPEKHAPPRKPADMPKYEEPKPKDWSEKNMFSGLEEEGN